LEESKKNIENNQENDLRGGKDPSNQIWSLN